MSDLFYLQDSRSNVGSRAMFWRLVEEMRRQWRCRADWLT